MRLPTPRAHKALLISFCIFGACAAAHAATLRIVDWNIEDDINGATTPLPGMNTVLQGIGNETIVGDAQPIDIMALEETTSNATTVQPILNMLNGDYTGANYQMSSYQATEEGGDTASGNGPNAIVYNANTVTLLASVGVGTPTGSGNGEYRQVVRYEFEPVGGSTPFYIYVSHMKSGSSSSDATDRGKEATIIRNDEATLPANASVIYTGDLNSNPPEAEFTNFTATGPGEAYDPVNFSTSVQYYSESATDLRYRDDYQLMTSNVLNDTGAINYVSGSLQSFGNNGTTSSGGNVDSGGNTDLAYMTAANGYSITQSQILSALTTASDHLPNIADYTFAPVPEPASICLLALGGISMLTRRRAR
jgi:endonuclease/exonuclease/phosphatase family metal-dependent hydrolase